MRQGERRRHRILGVAGARDVGRDRRRRGNRRDPRGAQALGQPCGVSRVVEVRRGEPVDFGRAHQGDRFRPLRRVARRAVLGHSVMADLVTRDAVDHERALHVAVGQQAHPVGAGQRLLGVGKGGQPEIKGAAIAGYYLRGGKPSGSLGGDGLLADPQAGQRIDTIAAGEHGDLDPGAAFRRDHRVGQAIAAAVGHPTGHIRRGRAGDAQRHHQTANHRQDFSYFLEPPPPAPIDFPRSGWFGGRFWADAIIANGRLGRRLFCRPIPADQRTASTASARPNRRDTSPAPARRRPRER